jgi:hypothetical protein
MAQDVLQLHPGVSLAQRGFPQTLSLQRHSRGSAQGSKEASRALHVVAIGWQLERSYACYGGTTLNVGRRLFHHGSDAQTARSLASMKRCNETRGRPLPILQRQDARLGRQPSLPGGLRLSGAAKQ